MQPKQWKAGIADETWKVIICGRDLYRIDDLLSALSHYLTDAGNDRSKGLDMVRQMTGAQIVDALEAHKRSSLVSVQRAIITEPQEWT